MPDLGVRRQAADQERRDTHQQQRPDHDRLAAEPVADVAHEERADRPGDVRDAEGGEGRDGGGGLVALGEEDLREHQRGGGAVDREVVVLQCAAEPGGDRRLARGVRCGVLRGAVVVMSLPFGSARRVQPGFGPSTWSGGRHMASVCHILPYVVPHGPSRTATPPHASPTSPGRPGSPRRRCPGPSRGRDRVNHATRDHVLAVAEELGYVPNPTARALESGRTNTLALLVPDITNPYFAGVIKGAERAAAAAGLTLVLGDTQENPAAEAAAGPPPRARRRRLRAERLPAARRRAARRRRARTRSRWSTGPPRGWPAWSRTTTPAPARSSTTSRRWGTARSCSSAARPSPGRARAAGRACGRPRQRGTAGHPVRALRAHARPAAPAAADAAVAAGGERRGRHNDMLAIGVMRRLAERGSPYPAEVSVVGFDDMFGAEFCCPR